MKKLFIYSTVVLLGFSSCTKDINSLNENTKAPEEVPAGMLFANAQKELFRFDASPNVNDNNLRLWAQHWTQTTYTDESNYELIERNVNGRTFNTLYANVLRDLNEARVFVDNDALLSDADKATQGAMITLMEVYTYHVLVDLFNDVPYSEANGLLDKLNPSYDDAETIYRDLLSRIDGALSALAGSGSSGELGSSDLIYSGSEMMWAEFGNSLKLKLALRMADVAPGDAQGWAEAAAGGALSSSSSNAVVSFEGGVPNTNPLWEDLVQSGRTDFIASQTLSDALNAQNDPRSAVFFRALDSLGSVTGNPHGSGGAYNNFSQPGDMLENPTMPHWIMSYDEVLFLKAEAAARGWAVGGTAEDFYNDALQASVELWTGAGTSDSTFLAVTAYDANNWKTVIGTQKWIAMYNRGFEAWSTWRLYDAPTMAAAAEAGTTPPMRYNYSVDEYSVNGESVSAANGGSDNVMDKVFWDVN